MADAISWRVARKLWTILFGHDSWARQNEDFRTRERYGLVLRANYAYGMLRAADSAKYVGIQSVTVVEMGVASGGGLLNMVDCADLITRETGVKFRIVGFDTGAGLPSVEGVKDHPEIWNPGDFVMEERTSLERKVAGRAEIIWGDIADNIDSFVLSLTPQSPLGFVSVDVDLYSAAKAGLRCFTGAPDKYLPAISVYCDDVCFFTANKWCGELAAIEEFNSEHKARKIDHDRSLITRPKKIETWYPSMYVCHILDHNSRQRSRDRKSLAIGDHAAFINAAKV